MTSRWVKMKPSVRGEGYIRLSVAGHTSVLQQAIEQKSHEKEKESPCGAHHSGITVRLGIDQEPAASRGVLDRSFHGTFRLRCLCRRVEISAESGP